jgi:D-glycero-D-manno-heptose 1,7-bisphosphate phosphatase
MTDEIQVKRALCLDLDRTIRYSKSGTPFIKGPDDIALYLDVEPILHEWKQEGYLIFGVTNQGGVAFGYKTAEQNEAEIKRTLELFSNDPFTRIYSSFMHPKGNVHPYNFRSLNRKPNIGMLASIEDDVAKHGYVIDWDNSLFVGDRNEDKECAKNAGIEFRWAKDFFGRSDE